MTIINEDYAYGSDSFNFILYKAHYIKDKRSKNYNKKTYEHIGFYSTLSGLIKALLNKVTKEEIDDLIRLEKRLNEIKQWVSKNFMIHAGD